MSTFEEKNIGKNSDVYEVNLIEIVQNLWTRKKFIVGVALVFICVGVFLFFYKKENPVYVTTNLLFVETGDKNIKDKTVGEGQNRSDVVLPLSLYSTILNSSSFLKELVYTPLKLKDGEENVTFAEYATLKKHRNLRFKDQIRKYTVDMPQTIRGDEDVMMDSMAVEEVCISKLKSGIAFQVDPQQNMMTLSVSFPDAEVSQQMLRQVKENLLKHITNLNVQSAEKNVLFLQKHYNATLQKMLQLQNEQQNVKNGRLVGNSLQEYKVLEVLGIELGVQLERARIEAEQVAPVFALIDATTTRVDANGHGIVLFIMIFAVLGGFVGMCLALMLPFVAQKTDCKYLRAWMPQSENE